MKAIFGLLILGALIISGCQYQTVEDDSFSGQYIPDSILEEDNELDYYGTPDGKDSEEYEESGTNFDGSNFNGGNDGGSPIMAKSHCSDGSGDF